MNVQDQVDRAGEARAPEALRAETFEPFLNSAVRFAGFETALTLARIEVGDPRWAAPGGREPFTLIFAGPRPDPQGRGLLPEGLHRCAFGDGGATHDIYVAPIHTPAPGRQDYQAVFD